ncbi:MAG TPA: efflux RND transporter periplasmic adaptor subunit [Tepidisphaeraceae bacterium]|nr:efflux RND transporter periplasmic adaptor subunit [Tepidisphaeraceae bacterium]
MVRIVLGIAGVALVVMLAGWGLVRLLRPTLNVTDAVQGPVVQAFYSTGTISPVREFPIRANVAGVLQKVTVDKGDRVRAGDELAAVYEPSLQFALEKAQAELAEKLARADEAQSPVLMEFDRRLEAMTGMVEIARREESRQTQALDALAGSQADLDRAMDRVRLLTMDVEATRAQRAAKQLELAREVDVARAAVNTARWNTEQQTLRAPIDGVVLDRPTSQGTRVAVNDTVMRVANIYPSDLVMRAAVDEEDVARVNVGQLVRLTLYSFPDQVFTGSVVRIYDQADSDRRTFEIDVKLDAPGDRLQPGMTGELAFIIAERETATVVPSQSVQNGGVWVVTSGGELARRDVVLGLVSIERTEIVSGVVPGERVVIGPVGNIPAGRRVSVNYIDPKQATGVAKQAPPPEGQAFKGIR